MTPDRFDPSQASRLSANRQDEALFPAVPEQNFQVRRMTLIALLIAAIVLPCVYVAAMAFSDFRAREADATDMALRTVRVAEEHALKVFDMNETLDSRIVDLTQDLGDDGIGAREADIHEKLRVMGGGYPQVAAVSIFGRDGRLLASRYATWAWNGAAPTARSRAWSRWRCGRAISARSTANCSAAATARR